MAADAPNRRARQEPYLIPSAGRCSTGSAGILLALSGILPDSIENSSGCEFVRSGCLTRSQLRRQDAGGNGLEARAPDVLASGQSSGRKLKRAVQHDRAVGGTALAVVADVGAMEIEIAIWQITAFNR